MNQLTEQIGQTGTAYRFIAGDHELAEQTGGSTHRIMERYQPIGLASCKQLSLQSQGCQGQAASSSFQLNDLSPQVKENIISSGLQTISQLSQPPTGHTSQWNGWALHNIQAGHLNSPFLNSIYCTSSRDTGEQSNSQPVQPQANQNKQLLFFWLQQEPKTKCSQQRNQVCATHLFSL